jgi:D-amino-acid oxidase
MADPDIEVVVIGAGVSGLTSALALLRAGLTVTIYAAEHPLRATSAAAGALWGVHLVGSDDRIDAWAAQTLGYFREVAADPRSGVQELYGVEAFLADQPDPSPPAPELTGVTKVDPAELPAGYLAGWRYRAPVITMPIYLEYLVDRVISAGGQLQFGPPLSDLAHAAAWSQPARVIVNCTGIGAAALVPDETMVPVRGQVVIAKNPGLTEFFVGEPGEDGETIYIFPHGSTVLLGGTEQPGNFSTAPDPAIAERILTACAEIEPRLTEAAVIGHRVGLRPVRPQVRLETADLEPGRFVVHNYGHGGAGVTLSWGCAQAVVTEVLAVLRP